LRVASGAALAVAIDKGIVSVNAYGIYENISFPLSFQIFKPKETLKRSEQYKTKIDLAGEIITEYPFNSSHTVLEARSAQSLRLVYGIISNRE